MLTCVTRRFGKAAPAGSGAQPSEAWDDTEFAYDSRNAGRWGNFFGGKPGGVPNFSRFSMGAVDPQTVGSDIKKSLWLTLEELFEGGLKQVQVQVLKLAHTRPHTLCLGTPNLPEHYRLSSSTKSPT